MPGIRETRRLPYSAEQMFDLVADVAVAISGIAGPDGGSASKPVGTVVFARAVRGSDTPDAESKLFEGEDRSGVRLQATLCALELLLP